MRAKFVVLLVMAVAGSILVAGCGSSSSSSSSSSAGPSSSSTAASTTSTPSTTSTAASSTTTSSSSSGSGSGGGNSAAAAAAKQGCEAGIKNNPAIDPSKQSALSADCQDVAAAAASGDKTKFKTVYLKYCNDLANALPSAAQSTAKAACEQAANAIP